MRSGFVTLLGRPNVGKSTILNRLVGEKVSIVSDKVQTTRFPVRGILNLEDAQVVFVDTPGIHKPRSPLGKRLNDEAVDSASGVDVCCLVIDATMKLGPGDRWVAERIGANPVAIVNKTDRAKPAEIAEQLGRLADLGIEFSDFFPVSGRTGDGLDLLVDHLVSRLPEGPALYPRDEVSDVPEAFQVAELVREQLLRATREEVPHSIACRVTEWEWPYIRVEILVERDSQKGIVIGKGGLVLKTVGERVRAQLPEGAFLELHVKVDKDWAHNESSLNRLGF